MNTKFKSAAEAAAFLADDKKVEQEVQTEVIQSRVVSALTQLRIERDMTQKDVADALEWSPSKVSRLESGNDSSLGWDDILGYASAVNFNIHMAFENPDLPAAERIKRNVFHIHELLENLIKMATALDGKVEGDDNFVDKINQFYGEVLFNFVARFQNSYGRFCRGVNVSQSPLELEMLPTPARDAKKKAKEPTDPVKV